MQVYVLCVFFNILHSFIYVSVTHQPNFQSIKSSIQSASSLAFCKFRQVFIVDFKRVLIVDVGALNNISREHRLRKFARSRSDIKTYSFSGVKNGSRSAKNSITSKSCRKGFEIEETTRAQRHRPEESSTEGSRPCVCGVQGPDARSKNLQTAF